MKSLPNIGDLVVVNNFPDATLYRVVEIVGKFGLGVVDDAMQRKGFSVATQYCDVSIVQKPTKNQLTSVSV